MITSILAMAVTWFLFYGRLSQPYLALLCVALGILLAYLGSHKHRGWLSIDVLAQSSRLKEVSVVLKFWTVLALIIISAASDNSLTGLFLLTAAIVLAVFAGGIKLHDYVHILALPVSFLLIGGLALLFEIMPEPTGILNFNILGYWLCISEKTQARATLIIARALGAATCLTFLSTTTPMPDIIAVLRKARCPDLIIDLMYLIYRYVFVLLSIHHSMRDAAVSRLGFKNYRRGIRSTGMIYSNLLARSYLFAGKNFDAMESRCYTTGIRFLERRDKITFAQAGVCAALLIIALYITLSVQ